MNPCHRKRSEKCKAVGYNGIATEAILACGIVNKMAHQLFSRDYGEKTNYRMKSQNTTVVSKWGNDGTQEGL